LVAAIRAREDVPQSISNKMFFDNPKLLYPLNLRAIQKRIRQTESSSRPLPQTGRGKGKCTSGYRPANPTLVLG
jgi:hypothetical protein